MYVCTQYCHKILCVYFRLLRAIILFMDCCKLIVAMYVTHHVWIYVYFKIYIHRILNLLIYNRIRECCCNHNTAIWYIRSTVYGASANPFLIKQCILAVKIFCYFVLFCCTRLRMHLSVLYLSGININIKGHVSSISGRVVYPFDLMYHVKCLL